MHPFQKLITSRHVKDIKNLICGCKTYWLLLFAQALFNTGRLHHDAWQTLRRKEIFENKTDIILTRC